MRNTDRFELIDGYRGIAALAVLGMHLMAAMHRHEAAGAYLAVDLFFVMSGFVIAHAYEAKLLSGMSLAEFILRRLQRLFPLMVVGALIGAAVGSARVSGLTLLDMTVRAIFLIPTSSRSQLHPGSLITLNNAGWSLLFELVANVIYALIVRRLSLWLLAAIVLTSAGALVDRAWHYGCLDFGWLTTHGIDGMFRASFGFFVGIVLFRLRNHPRVSNLRVNPTVAVGALVIILMWPAPAHHRVIPDLLAVFALIPPIVVVGMNTRLSGRTAMVCAWLGAISYPLYIIQSGPVILFHGIVGGLSLGTGPAMATAAVFGALTLGIAYAALKLVDEPAQRWFKWRRASARKAQSSQPAIGPILGDPTL